jgi:hypothetical protein
MARLFVLPIRDRGDSVVIVTHCEGVPLMGFVARSTLEGFFKRSASMCQCVAFVQRNLPRFEQILLRKTTGARSAETMIVCVEAVDLVVHRIAESS